MDLSIIVLSYNTEHLLEDCLESLFKNTKGISYEVIVVDNASSDGSVPMIRKKFSEVTLIESKENLGFARGNNYGMKAAKGRYLLFLNSDTIVKTNAFSTMVKFADEHQEVGVVGPKLLNRDGTSQDSVGKFPSLPVVFLMLFKEHFGGSQSVRTSFSQARMVDWVMGAAFMVRREVVEKVGGFDEKIFMYFDEVEWCYRIKKAGFQVCFYPGAEITHLWQGSSTSGRKGPIIANFRGLLYFYQKHKSFSELLTLRFLLKLKASLALVVGYVTNNPYLKETYGEAIKLA